MNHNLPPGVRESDCDGTPLPVCLECGSKHHNYGEDYCYSCQRDEYEDNMEHLDRPNLNPAPEKRVSGVLAVILIWSVACMMSFSLIVLKLAGFHRLSWWKITAPLWIPTALAVAAAIIGLLIWSLLSVAHRAHNRKGKK